MISIRTALVQWMPKAVAFVLPRLRTIKPSAIGFMVAASINQPSEAVERLMIAIAMIRPDAMSRMPFTEG